MGPRRNNGVRIVARRPYFTAVGILPTVTTLANRHTGQVIWPHVLKEEAQILALHITRRKLNQYQKLPLSPHSSKEVDIFLLEHYVVLEAGDQELLDINNLGNQEEVQRGQGTV